MKELRRVSAAILISFAIIALTASYWQVIESPSLTAREDNPRQVEATVVIQRGNIYDAQGILLTTTTENYNGTGLRRLYPHPEVAPVVGYYSLRYGTNGIEATRNPLLSGQEGPTPIQEAWRKLLHQPAVGGDVRLTLDLQVQRAAAEALGESQGAIVVATVPDGAIRAMVSAPIFDPNFLDEDWNVLIQSPDAPLLNRVTQGVYQPGSLMQTFLIATVLSRRESIDLALINSSDPVEVNGLTLECAVTPPGPILTLREAYRYGCPAAFLNAATDLDPEVIDAALWNFGLMEPPPLRGLPTETGDSPLPLAYLKHDEPALWAALTGQGTLTVTPLQVLQLVTAFANDGNIPPLRLVEATRLPGSATWELEDGQGLSRAVLTAQNAAILRSLMETTISPALIAAQSNTPYTLVGHVSTAYSGPDADPLQWFMGIVRFDEQSSIAAVVVLEDTPDPQTAVDVGTQVLLAAAAAYTPPPPPEATPTVAPTPAS
jgi:peptidoglycan glycosyltransferase